MVQNHHHQWSLFSFSSSFVVANGREQKIFYRPSEHYYCQFFKCLNGWKVVNSQFRIRRSNGEVCDVMFWWKSVKLGCRVRENVWTLVAISNSSRSKRWMQSIRKEFDLFPSCLTTSEPRHRYYWSTWMQSVIRSSKGLRESGQIFQVKVVEKSSLLSGVWNPFPFHHQEYLELIGIIIVIEWQEEKSTLGKKITSASTRVKSKQRHFFLCCSCCCCSVRVEKF